MTPVEDAARAQLRAALDDRGLLLGEADLVAGIEAAAALGRRLLTDVVERAYRDVLASRASVRIAFGHSGTGPRMGMALAFGALVARLVRPVGARPFPDEPDLLCAVFNLGIGLVDSLCDASPHEGLPLLCALGELDLPGLVAPEGGLATTVCPDLLADPTVAFTVRVVGLFFDQVHSVLSGDDSRGARSRVGLLLADALAAERRSVGRGSGGDGESLVETSRRTSVLPFQTLSILAGGAPDGPAWATATALGEAMWRVDDLVDVGQDAESGALNSLLVAGGDLDARICVAAREAAEQLATALEVAPGGAAANARRDLLACVQSYARL